MKHEHSKLAALTYLLFFAPLFTKHKNDPFMKYHTHQAIGLLIFALSLQGAISILGYWGIAPFGLPVWIVRFVLVYELIVGVRNALGGKTAPLPWIGDYSQRLFS
ncbi:MAG: hypothetical protein AAB495_01600 [Patescibacteria group bacterium]